MRDELIERVLRLSDEQAKAVILLWSLGSAAVEAFLESGLKGAAGVFEFMESYSERGTI